MLQIIFWAIVIIVLLVLCYAWLSGTIKPFLERVYGKEYNMVTRGSLAIIIIVIAIAISIIMRLY